MSATSHLADVWRWQSAVRIWRCRQAVQEPALLPKTRNSSIPYVLRGGLTTRGKFCRHNPARRTGRLRPHLGDIATIDLGSQSYSNISHVSEALGTLLQAYISCRGKRHESGRESQGPPFGSSKSIFRPDVATASAYSNDRFTFPLPSTNF